MNLSEPCAVGGNHGMAFSSFSLDRHGNAEPILTLVLRLFVCLTVFEVDRKINPYDFQSFPKLTQNLATPELLRQHMDKT